MTPCQNNNRKKNEISFGKKGLSGLCHHNTIHREMTPLYTVPCCGQHLGFPTRWCSNLFEYSVNARTRYLNKRCKIAQNQNLKIGRSLSGCLIQSISTGVHHNPSFPEFWPVTQNRKKMHNIHSDAVYTNWGLTGPESYHKTVLTVGKEFRYFPPYVLFYICF